jgi:hypothetical protein
MGIGSKKVTNTRRTDGNENRKLFRQKMEVLDRKPTHALFKFTVGLGICFSAYYLLYSGTSPKTDARMFGYNIKKMMKSTFAYTHRVDPITAEKRDIDEAKVIVRNLKDNNGGHIPGKAYDAVYGDSSVGNYQYLQKSTRLYTQTDASGQPVTSDYQSLENVGPDENAIKGIQAEYKKIVEEQAELKKIISDKSSDVNTINQANSKFNELEKKLKEDWPVNAIALVAETAKRDVGGEKQLDTLQASMKPRKEATGEIRDKAWWSPSYGAGNTKDYVLYLMPKTDKHEDAAGNKLNDEEYKKYRETLSKFNGGYLNVEFPPDAHIASATRSKVEWQYVYNEPTKFDTAINAIDDAADQLSNTWGPQKTIVKATVVTRPVLNYLEPSFIYTDGKQEMGEKYANWEQADTDGLVERVGVGVVNVGRSIQTKWHYLLSEHKLYFFSDEMTNKFIDEQEEKL